jgi:hypothetical protein
MSSHGPGFWEDSDWDSSARKTATILHLGDHFKRRRLNAVMPCALADWLMRARRL